MERSAASSCLISAKLALRSLFSARMRWYSGLSVMALAVDDATCAQLTCGLVCCWPFCTAALDFVEGVWERFVGFEKGKVSWRLVLRCLDPDRDLELDLDWCLARGVRLPDPCPSLGNSWSL